MARTEMLLIELPFDELFDDVLNMLPCAQTCGNTLQLPNYWHALQRVRRADQSDVEIRSIMRTTLRHKMAMAVAETAGYGLDDAVVHTEEQGGPTAGFLIEAAEVDGIPPLSEAEVSAALASTASGKIGGSVMPNGQIHETPAGSNEFVTLSSSVGSQQFGSLTPNDSFRTANCRLRDNTPNGHVWNTDTAVGHLSSLGDSGFFLIDDFNC